MNIEALESLMEYKKKARYVMHKLHKGAEELERINKYLQEEIKRLEAMLPKKGK